MWSAVKLHAAFAAVVLFALAGINLDRAAAAQKKEPVKFYGKKATFLKLFGQKSWGEHSPGRITGNKIYHAAGVLVDRSAKPNHIYVADTGNNRILGFRSFDSAKADIIFGQPDESSGAPNGDCNLGSHAKPTRSSLCLMNVPENTNIAEQWMRLNFDVDGEGNLYIPDFYNNRVLIYFAPFSKDKAGGKGDNLPDLVLGQDDFTSNGINRGKGPGKRDAQSLYLSFGGFDHVSARGVSVDAKGNVWVADTFNFRVLRFPKGKKTADLVLGQPNFTVSEPTNQSRPEKARLDRMCTPTLARINPDTGELWVVDEYPGGFPGRILVFKPPFKNGMAAARVVVPKQRLEGDYSKGYRLTHVTGLVFNPVKTDDWIDQTKKTHRYRDGVVWLHEGAGGFGPRTLLLDAKDEILLALGAPDLITGGGRYDKFLETGPEVPFNLVYPGGMIGFDSDNNIYLADEAWHRIARFALPYRMRKTDKGMVYPKSSGMFPGTLPNTVGPAHFSGPSFGAITHRGQLIVRDHKRYMAWSDYLSKPDGAAADVIVGQKNGEDVSGHNEIYARATHAVDHKDRLWACSAHGRLMVYELPLKNGAKPLRQLIPLHWADEPDKEVAFRCEQVLTFEPHTKKLWVFDTAHHRLLRVRIPDDLKDKFLVDAVIGQKDKTEGRLNRGMNRPDAASFGDVNDIRFDRKGNLFVVDNTYELHHNGRIIAFLAEDVRKIDTMFPKIEAKKVYVAERMDQPVGARTFAPGQHPHSPVCVAFNSRNEMVVGNDGYFKDAKTRHLNQLYLYRDPLKKATPDAVIELPMGAPGEISFDERDNLIVQDHTWCKVWVINYERDPAWLRPLAR